jgi:hypothetical protein
MNLCCRAAEFLVDNHYQLAKRLMQLKTVVKKIFENHYQLGFESGENQKCRESRFRGTLTAV